MDKDKLLQQHTENILKLVIPDITTSKKRHAASNLDLPDIGKPSKDASKVKMSPAADTITSVHPESISAQPPQPQQDMQSDVKLLQETLSLQDSVQDLEREVRLKDIKEEIHDEVHQIIHRLQEELDDLKGRKIPEIGSVETDGAYREHLYPLATNLLNKIVVPLVSQVPTYNLIATNVTDTYDDGSIKNGVVTLNMRLLNNDCVYDFKVDVVVLNGLMQYPTFVTRGRRLIPLTQQDLNAELQTYSFRPVDIVTRYKGNPFSNVGENIHRKRDTQKFYPVDMQEPQPVGLAENSRWITHKRRDI